MKSIIIGAGEIGKSLHKVIGGDIVDRDEIELEEYDIMHICFPYSEDFITEVLKYQNKYEPKYTVIHSTLPVGTSRKCNAIHSPIRGIHPNLEKGILTFVKFLGGEQASEIADYFRRKGIKVCLFDKSETTEALKLFDTEYYRVCIEFAHRVKRYCDKNDLNFSEVYRISNLTYNEGYEKLGNKEFIRPILEPIKGKIGGHCVENNSILLSKSET